MSPVLRVIDAKARIGNITFRADRAVLKGRIFYPDGTPRAAVVIHAATGVPARYYRHFAAWMAQQGYACLTWDYRDFGASATGHVRESDATMADWGVRDQQAAQKEMQARIPGVPLWVIGHSLGGMMVPFHDSADTIARLVTVASGHVHLRDHPWPYRALATLFWKGPVPWIAALAGYLPAKRLGLGPDLPGGVYRQWRKWCTSDGFFMPDVGDGLPVPDRNRFSGPVRFVAVEGDVMMPPHTVWRSMRMYPQADKTQVTLRAGDFGLEKIGHIDVFHPRNAVLWPGIIGG
jgi:predicted alpha/beta hydrolase